MRRVLSPVPLAVLAAVAALVALLAYGLAENEPDRSFEDAAAVAVAEVGDKICRLIRKGRRKSPFSYLGISPRVGQVSSPR